MTTSDPESRPDRKARVVPLFPLQGVLLFPGLIQPLHVFEPRYVHMVKDALDTRGELVLGSVLGASSEEMVGAPDVESVAGLGRIEHYREGSDDRYHILLRGISRVKIIEVASKHSYRLVRCSLLKEVKCTPQESAELRPRLLEALGKRSTRDLELPEEVSVEQLADLLLALLSLPETLQHELYAQATVSERARAILASDDE